MNKKSIEELVKIHADQKSTKSNFMTLWQDIGDYIFPRKSSVLVQRSPGEDLQVHLYDNTAPHSLELFAGMMMSIMMSVEDDWLEVTSGDVALDELDNVKVFLQDTSKKIHGILANSNFYNEAHEMLMDIGGFGTSIFGIEEDPEDHVRFFAKFIGEATIGENAQGKVDIIFMEYDWTASQIVSEYGDKKLPDEVRKCLEKNDQRKFKVVHAIYKCDPTGKPNKKGHVYYSHHYVDDYKFELKVGGYKTFPYAVPRFAKASGEVYGRCPGMVALPEAKVLNKMVEITLIGGEKAIEPPLQAPDDGFITQINTFPGGISFYRAGSQDRIEPVFNDSRVDFGFEMISEKQSKIRDAFYINQMMIQPKSGNPATATEIAQRVEQSMRFMGPFLARMQKEFLQVVVDRVIEILFKKGVLRVEDIPQELRGKRFSVKFTSFIARAQRSGSLGQMLRFFSMAEPAINLDPSSRHVINASGYLRSAANMLGIPYEMLRSKEEADNIAKEEAQAAQQQAQAQTNAETLKAAGQAVKMTQQGG